MTGRFIVAATPIGNLGDITTRVLEALGSADAILAEDTRVTRRMLERFSIHTPLERCDEHVIRAKASSLVERVQAGETLVLVSDAGTPGVSDPGSSLVQAMVEAGIEPEVLPGASAVMVALVCSGLPTERFYFGGFLPRKASQRVSTLSALALLDATLVFYESPHRAAASLEAIRAVFPGRRCALARELTKLHEEVVRGTVEEVCADISARDSIKGEVVLLVGPPVAREEPGLDVDRIRERVDAYVVEGSSRSDAVRRVAEETGLARNDVYSAVHGRGR